MKVPYLVSLVVLLSTVLSRPAHASFINYSSREINVKIVYYAPDNTTAAHDNLLYVYDKTKPAEKSKLSQLAHQGNGNGNSGNGSTVFFDYLPLALGEIGGFKTRFHLYTVPGPDDYKASRVLLLNGVDGIVFIANAAPPQAKANLARLAELKTNLKDLGYDFDKMSVVFQFVGTSEPGATSVADLKIALGIGVQPVFEANPTTGVGVFDTLKAIAKLVLMQLKSGADKATETNVPPPTVKHKATLKGTPKKTAR